MRFRKPSIKTALGITKMKKQANKALGITAAKKPLRAPGNAKRRVERTMGYESTPMKVARSLKKK